MEEKMENQMGTGGISGFKGLSLSYHVGETLLSTIHSHTGSSV